MRLGLCGPCAGRLGGEDEEGREKDPEREAEERSEWMSKKKGEDEKKEARKKRG